MANKVYNINAMRPALVKMREGGNRGVITKKVCSELGISETYYSWYKSSIEKLFEVVCAYCRVKNSPKASAAEVGAAHEAIFPVWKDMLSTAERDKMKRELRVTEHDISNLVSFCQTFVNDANDVSRGKDESFVAHKVWAVQPLKQFQKRVEIDLGIRIAQVEVMSDTDRDFLNAERKVLNKWKKAERRIEEISANKERLIALKTKMKGDEAKALLDEQIKDMDTQIAELNTRIEDCKKQHEQLLNPPEPEKAEGTEAAAEAKPKRTRKRKNKDKAEPAEGPKAPADDTMVVSKEDAA